MQDKIINLLKNNETESLCGEYFLIKRKDYEKLANEIQLIFALTDVVKSFYCASELYEDKKCKNQCDSCIELKKLHTQ